MVRSMCDKYGIPPVTENADVDNEFIKYKVKRFAEVESWKSCVGCRLVVTRPFIRSAPRFYYRMNRVEGRAVLLWRCGYLKFKDSWRKYHSKRGGTRCPNIFCSEDDSLNHALRCRFATVKIENANTGTPFEIRMARFLVNLDRERSKIKLPIL